MHKIAKYISVKLIVVAVFLSGIPYEGLLKAQQDPMYTQYMFNTLSVNPAYAGSREQLSLLLLARQQWVGFKGAPSTGTLTAHSPIYNNMAAGVSIIYDSYGPVNHTSFYVDYAYHLQLNSETKLSMGLKGGFDLYSMDYNGLDRTTNVDDAYYNATEQTMLSNFGFGLFLYSNRYYIGLSVPRIIEDRFKDHSESLDDGTEVRHYYGMAGVVIHLNDWLAIRPSIMTRLVQGAPFSLDANINTVMYDKLWLGAMYRINEAFGGIVQYQITQQFKVGYAFEFSTNELSSYNNGTHEVMINYEFNFNKEKVINPRYF